MRKRELIVNKIILVFLCILVFSMNQGLIHAADETGLKLETEDLKNKKNDYSSLTDINGIDLFTEEVQVRITEKENKEENENIKESLFTTKDTDKKEESLEQELFSTPVSFEKVSEDSIQHSSLEMIVILLTIGSGFFVFVITKNKYKRREKDINETNIDFYE